MSKNLSNIENKLKKIEETQQKIEEHEKKIDHTESEILQTIKENPLDLLSIETGSPQTKAGILRLAVIKKLSKHKLFFGLLITFALVSIWRGVWHLLDATPVPYSEAVFLLIGVLILVGIKKLSELGH